MIRRKKIQLLFCIVNILYALESGVSAASGSNVTTDGYSATTDPSEYNSTRTTEYATTESTYPDDHTATDSTSNSTTVEGKTAIVEGKIATETTTLFTEISTSTQTAEYSATESIYPENYTTARKSSSYSANVGGKAANESAITLLIETSTESNCRGEYN